MKKFTIFFVMAAALVFSSFVTAQDHLLLTEIVVNPTDAEFVEIFNPTDATIDLSNYYLTDATYEYGGSYYYNITTGADFGGGAYGDFHARFPDGAMIEAGEYQTVAMNGDSLFMAVYGVLPTYEIGEDSTSGDDVPDMREAVEGSVNGIQGGLSNGDEVLIMYYWDGMTDLVQDIDYLLWDDGAEVPNESIDKMGITIDGPDADTDSSTYLNDTPTASQAYAASPDMDMSIQRIDMTEGTEVKTGGNGMTGNDETSENLNETWAEADPTPNAPAVMVEAPMVTFQCDMSIQIAANNFDPAADQLLVRGTINGWAGTADELTDTDADQIYTLTKEFAAADIGTAYEYKHVIVPAAGGDMWENVDNRKFTLADGDQVLDVVFYDNVDVLLETALVTFQGDMSDLLDNGWFDPATDSIRVVGGMNGWANNESCEPDPFDPSLYVYEMDVTAAPASEIGWKFRAYPNDSFLDGGWEGGDGSTFEFLGAGQDLILEPVKPNLLPAGKELAQDVTVRFSVDVNGSVDSYNEQPFENIEKVFVTGDWNNWGGAWSVADTATLINMYDDGITMGDAVAGDGIWTTEAVFEAGVSNTRLYKYSIYAAGVDTLNGGTEPMDNEAGTGMNHVVIIEDTNPTFVVPEDFFGSQWREKPMNPTVTFQCDMSIQIAANNFDPAADKLLVRGTINGWAGTADELTDTDADQIYTLTKEFAAGDVGAAHEYKHVLVPAAGGDMWENVDNRKFTLADGDQVLDVVFYDNISVLLETALVTFQGDMADLLDNGWFDPATDSIRVVGGMNGWANNESAEPDPFDPSLYVYEMDVTAAPESEINWKYRAYPNDSFLDGGWEGGDGYTFEFLGAGQDLILDPVKPNLLPAGKELAQDVTVRFSVDVNGSVDFYNEELFENIEKVFVTGDWNNWGGAWSVADTATLINLYDDGTKGDAVPGDGIWTTEVVFEAGVSNTRLYKYSIYAAGVDTLNGGTEPMDNEAGTGMNHVVIIEDTNPTFVVPQDYFGSQWRVVAVERLPVSILPTEFSLKQNYPNPFNPATTINYDLPNASVVKLSVFNSIGQRIASLVNEEQVAGSYQVMWNAHDDMGNAVSTGVYFYYIQADNFVRTMKMLYIK